MSRMNWVAKVSKEPIVDIGCGDSPYFDEDVDFIGVDVEEDSEDMVGDRPENFVEADGKNLPFDDEKFNTAILAEVLEHTDNPVAVIKEAKRVATERVVITVPDEHRWLPEAQPYEHDDHKRIYSGKELADHCKKAGFNEGQVKIDHLNEFPFVFWLASCRVKSTS